MLLRRYLFSSALLFAACAADGAADRQAAAATPAEPATPVVAPPVPDAGKPAEVATAPAATPKSLKSAMKGIEDDWHHIEKALEGDPSTDMPAIAAAATRVAGVMKLAYDPFEDKEVPDFAKLAREAEAAMIDFAKAASDGNAEAVRTLGKTLQAQHCARCHDAVEEAKG